MSNGTLKECMENVTKTITNASPGRVLPHTSRKPGIESILRESDQDTDPDCTDILMPPDSGQKQESPRKTMYAKSEI